MRSALSDKELTLSDYETYAKASDAVQSTYYTETTALNGTDSFQPVSDSSSSSSSSSSGADTSDTDQQNMPEGMPSGGMGGGAGGGMMMASGDFSLAGFSSDEAVANASNGSFTMESGEVFTYDDADAGNVIITSTLADFNGLSVGDTIDVESVSDDAETYQLTVVGIYENDTESNTTMGGPMASTSSDPANAIYTSIATLTKLGLDADDTITTTDGNGNETTGAAAQLSYTYVFADKDSYEAFADEAKAAGLDDSYTVSSADVEAYESSLVPLDNLSQFALALLIIVLVVGAVVLVVITLFNVRERKYEVGVLTAIGVRKAKVAAQFTIELLTVTVIGLIVGTIIGAATSVPVSNQLLAAQVEQQQTQQTNQVAQFGREMQQPGGGEAPSGAPDQNATSSDADEEQAAPGGQNGKDSAPQNMPGGFQQAADYVSSVNATVNLGVVGQLLLIGLALTLVAALVAIIFVMRYEPLQILADRS